MPAGRPSELYCSQLPPLPGGVLAARSYYMHINLMESVRNRPLAAVVK